MAYLEEKNIIKFPIIKPIVEGIFGIKDFKSFYTDCFNSDMIDLNTYKVGKMKGIPIECVWHEIKINIKSSDAFTSSLIGKYEVKSTNHIVEKTCWGKIYFSEILPSSNIYMLKYGWAGENTVYYQKNADNLFTRIQNPESMKITFSDEDDKTLEKDVAYSKKD